MVRRELVAFEIFSCARVQLLFSFRGKFVWCQGYFCKCWLVVPIALTPCASLPWARHNPRLFLQLCDFGALKQQHQTSKQKHDASPSLQGGGRASASPTRLRPRSQHGGANLNSSHEKVSPSATNASPNARNLDSSSPLRLSSPNSPQALTHKNYKASCPSSPAPPQSHVCARFMPVGALEQMPAPCRARA